MRHFIDLAKRLLESDQDEWQEAMASGDWGEAFELSDTPEQVAQVLEACGARKITFRQAPSTDPIYVFDDKVVEWDGKDQYTTIKPRHRWIYDIDPESYFPDHTDRFNRDFWAHPVPLYHETPDENVPAIQREGIGTRNQTRGLNNRGVGAAVFTTLDIEECQGSYGGNVFEIDTAAMLGDGYTPYVEQEPPIVEEELRSSLARQIGWDDYEPDGSSDISADTVIVHGAIPAKYLRLEE